MISALFEVALPVFGIAFLGWLFAGWRRIELSGVADLVLYVFAPALVFSSLTEQSVDGRRLLLVGGGAVFQVLVSGAVAWAVFRLARVPGRGLYLPAMFPNTGNLGLPLALFAFGAEGLSVAVIVFVSVVLFHFSLGLAIVAGDARPSRLLRMPLVWAAVLGVALSFTPVELPEALGKMLEIVGQGTVPLMLLSLGIRMRSVRLRRPGLAFLAVALRMVPGLAAGFAWVALFGLEGAERGVLLVTGVLPAAVMNFMLAEAHGEQPEEVASAVLLSTLIALATIPAVLGWVI